MSTSLKIAFIHPDLGIGGAERLVVDAALALKSKNHQVEFFTSHHSHDLCFKETKDGTLKVTAYGDWIPRSLFGYLHILFSILRMLYVSIMVVLSHEKFDVYFVDQVSVNIPVFTWFTSSKVIFYCHHPDKLLATKKSFLRDLYRWPFDFLEESTTRMAHKILVNSKYTQDVFKLSFPSIKLVPEILFPTLDLKSHDKKPEKSGKLEDLLNGKPFIASVNRFERKKNIPLALDAFSKISSKFPDVMLVLAGGYDERVSENISVLAELKKSVKDYGLEYRVVYLPAFVESDRYFIFHEAKSILYTPENEHFGIVPVEAQYGGRIVVACNSGGPLETIDDKTTGFLVNPNADSFADAISKILSLSEEEYKIMSKKARNHVIKKFSFDSFANQLNDVVVKTLVK